MIATQRPRAFLRLGPVKMSSDHDWRQFCFSILLVIAVGVFVAWTWSEGYFQTADQLMGRAFTWGFCALLLWGLAEGIGQNFVLSRAINMVKRARNLADLSGVFGFEPNARVSAEYLADVVQDQLDLRVGRVKYVQRLATLLGYFGTVLGLVLMCAHLKEVRSQQDIFRVLPGMAEGLMMAFSTTIVGIVVFVAVRQMGRLVERASVSLKAKIMRRLQEDRQ